MKRRQKKKQQISKMSSPPRASPSPLEKAIVSLEAALAENSAQPLLRHPFFSLAVKPSPLQTAIVEKISNKN
jgi:hypothetical protein